MEPRIGCHLSIGKGLKATAEKAVSLGLETFQVFVRNPRGAAARAWSEQEIAEFTKTVEQSGIDPVIVHIPYIVNPASNRQDLYELAERIIREDLERAIALKARYLVLHPGSRGEGSAEEAIERLTALLQRVLHKYTGDTMILIETMAGMGKEIGHEFSQIKTILNGVNHPMLGLCLDTCHLLGAGYDVVSKEGIAATLEELGRYMDLNLVKVVHANDSQKEINSRIDRHAPIGTGFIGRQGFVNLMAHPKLKKLPFILETPPETIEQDVQVMRELRELAAKAV